MVIMNGYFTIFCFYSSVITYCDIETDYHRPEDWEVFYFTSILINYAVLDLTYAWGLIGEFFFLENDGLVAIYVGSNRKEKGAGVSLNPYETEENVMMPHAYFV